ncbi:uncharacterized protein LOC132269844 [Cornus florida]|uniref:uncharacterized protein LOC132269844 n=1 Tax=Cornus florida TaxID=4283 RepID=UPI0028A0E6B4|nr:uncharacterized protein LOC132269844 [Cornus florida]
MAEGLVFREALVQLRYWGYHKVIVEGDYQSVMRLVASVDAFHVIFSDILLLLKDCVGSSLAWIPHEGNLVAHLLSKHAFKAACGYLEWSTWPSWLLNALFSDYVSSSF